MCELKGTKTSITKP